MGKVAEPTDTLEEQLRSDEEKNLSDALRKAAKAELNLVRKRWVAPREEDANK